MTPRARRLAPFAAVLTAGLLAACGSGDPETTPSEPTSSTATETATESTTDTPATESADGPAQQQLTKQQILEALPKVSDAPKGFVEDPRINPPSESTREVNPDKCRAIYLDSDEIRAWKKEHHTRIEGVRYSHPGNTPGRPSVSTFIATYDQPVPKKFFDDAGSMLGECATFEERNDADSTWINKKASNINAPVVGDQTYAHRSGLADVDLTIDQLWVRSGHNIINIRILTGYSNYSEETMSDIAEGVLEDLRG